MSRNIPIPGEKYTHFKGNTYQIVCIAKDSEDGRDMVVYQALYGDFTVYVRPLDMFLSEVDRAKYPDAKQRYRFERANDLSIHLTETMASSEPVALSLAEAPEEGEVDPALILFLDTDSLDKKYEIIAAVRARITDYLIDTFAVCLDVVIPDGDIDYRYQQLLKSIRMMQKYENTRLR